MNRKKLHKSAQCEGKGQFTKLQAKSMARWMRQRGRKVQAYKCAFCGSHHVGGTD